MVDKLTSQGRRDVLISLREGRVALAEMRQAAQREQSEIEVRFQKLTKALVVVDFLLGEVQGTAQS
jgi:predicted transcriptional regulator